MESSLSKVLLVSGLRGTGKSIGVLQAMQGKDAVYIIMEKGIHTSADEGMRVLESRTEKIIILDEYTWIENRKNSELDGFLFTLASHGKRVVVTGTESLSLEALKTGPLIHRAITLHTTHMSFADYMISRWIKTRVTFTLRRVVYLRAMLLIMSIQWQTI